MSQRFPLGWIATAALLAGCLRGSPSERPPIHLNPNMDDQPRYEAQEASRFFYDGAAMRPPVPGTVARGELPAEEAFATGRTFWGGYVSSIPMEVTGEVTARGWERYQIFCSPCHGPKGDGRGMIRLRGGVEAADLLAPRVRQMPPGRILHAITQGVGLMPSYRSSIPAADRWAIVAYLERLQDRASRGAVEPPSSAPARGGP